MCQLDGVNTNPWIKRTSESRSRRDLAQNAAKLVKIHRLRQMKIESSFSTALNIIACRKTGYCHRFHGSFSFRFHDYIVAVPVWQRDITQDNVELFGIDHVQCAPGIISRGNI